MQQRRHSQRVFPGPGFALGVQVARCCKCGQVGDRAVIGNRTHTQSLPDLWLLENGSRHE